MPGGDPAACLMSARLQRVGDSGRVYWGAGVVFALCATLCAVAMALVLRSMVLNEAQRSLEELGSALSSQVANSIQAADVVLQDAGRRVADAQSARPGALASPQVRAILREHISEFGLLRDMVVIDATGHSVNMTHDTASAVIDVTDRPYFKAVRAADEAGLVISDPLTSRVDGRRVLVLARRLPGVNFSGAVAGILPIEEVEAALGVAATRPGEVVRLLRTDRTVLTDVPREASHGEGTRAGPLAADMVVWSRAVTGLPLVVEIGLPRTEALAIWRAQLVMIGLVTLASICCVVIMLGALLRQFRAQQKVRRALAERNAELEEARVRLERQTAELEATADALRGGEMLLAERSTMLTTTLQNITQGIMMVDEDGRVVVYNQRVVELLGLPDSLLSQNPSFKAVLDYQWKSGEFASSEPAIANFLRSGGMDRDPHVYTRVRPSGQVIEFRSLPLPAGGMVRTFTDVTELKRQQSLIERAALFDEMTGLSTWLSLRRELARRLQPSEAETPLALLSIDLDRFRLINDARGYEVGDKVLIETARRLKDAVPADDVVSRTGGDKFAILHACLPGTDDSARLAARLLQAVAEPHVINGARMAVTASIGTASAGGASTAEAMLRNADIAMYRAKDAAGNQLCHYEPAMAVAQQQRFQLEQELRAALGTSAFRLAYQPIVSLETGTISGYEALLRWTDPVRGEVSPSLFIPIAEATGLIVPLGRAVLEWACFEAAGWPNERTIAVNLSPAQFQGGGLLRTVEDVLQRSGLDANRLELEVTEGMLLENTQAVLDTMLALRRIGVSLTLDDFGTGHAGLSSLRRFPFEKIKIDRSFVSNLGVDPDSDAIVEAVLLLCRRLDLRVVAEGVELETQLAELRRLRCSFVQGYLTGRPEFAETIQAADVTASEALLASPGVR